MATIPCPECGNQVSTEAKACPKCGRPFRKKSVVARTNGPLLITGAVLMFLIYAVVSGGVLAITLLFIAVIPAMIASSKGEDFLKWYCYGILLWIVALPHSLLINN